MPTLSRKKTLDPIANEERKQIKTIVRILRSSKTKKPVYISIGSEKIEVPESLLKGWTAVSQAAAQGQKCSLVSERQEMTTQQAADVLDVSRPYLIKLLEEGKIPHRKVGNHRRVDFKDLKEYEEKMRTLRENKLAEMVKINQELGLYDVEDNPMIRK